MTTDDEMTREFLVECHENLDHLDRELVAFEEAPATAERLAAIFRTVHTIKGSAGVLGFTKLEALTHSGESLLAKVRAGQLPLSPVIASGLLQMVDKARSVLRSVEMTGGEGSEDCQVLADYLLALATPKVERQRLSAFASRASVAATAAHLAVMPAATGLPAPIAPRPTAAAAAAPLPAPVPIDVAEPPAPPAATAAAHGHIVETNVRVDVALLDKLMNLVGELVLARNQILQFADGNEEASFVSASQRLNLITTELQAGVMKTRMQPIGNVWSKLPRVVRDLAVSCGKQVTIEMAGQETELDRTIIEAIKDPLTHIVRNSVDHGLELPEARVAAGKAATGTLSLHAFHEGGQVNIEIRDDGAGINAEAVRQKAIKSGLVTAERAARMTERELVHLIFLPGFSTAKSVTNISGRGVGMDVVKTNIEKIGGVVAIESHERVGTTIRIKIPLTLAIVPALIVTSRGHRFAIPQANLLELVRLEGQQAARSVETVHGAAVYRLRGNLLPLVDLGSALGLDGRRATTASDASAEERVITIVVLQADDRQFGLVVDEIKDTEEIVVKPLGKELKGVTVFAGATVMGDGRVALILDVVGLAQKAGAMSTMRDRAAAQDGSSRGSSLAGAEDELESVLLFRVGKDGCMALPLSSVARLEEFSRERLERAGRQQVVQYRGEVLPLIQLTEALGTVERTPRSGDEPLRVIVYSENGRSVGLVVDAIVDIVEGSLKVSHRSAHACVAGAAVIQGKVTELLDINALIELHDPTFFEASAA